MSFPYILKVDVVKILLNKIDSEPNTFRYRGSISNENDAVKYDKAWKAKLMKVMCNSTFHLQFFLNFTVL